MRRGGHRGPLGGRLAAGLLLAFLVAVPCPGSARLYLLDGQVLEGTEVWREGDDYSIRTRNGGVVTIPAGLVSRVGLSIDAPEPPAAATQGPQDEDLPSHLTRAEPERLAGSGPPPVSASEQLSVFGEPSTFQQDIVDPYWRPRSDWDADPGDAARNDFAPSRWQQGVLDPAWRPDNALDANPADPRRNDFAPSEFQKNIIDNTWVPQDGFRR